MDDAYQEAPRRGSSTGFLSALLEDHGGAVQTAALHIEDSMRGVTQQHPRNLKNARVAFRLRFDCLPFVRLATFLSLVLTFLERPLWCSQPEMVKHFSAKNEIEPCSNPMYSSYPISYLSETWDFWLELTFLVPLVGDCLVLIYAQGSKFWSVERQPSRVVMILATIADMAYAYSTPYWWFRCAPYLRLLLFISYSHKVRKELEMICRTLPEVLSVVALALLFITSFAWFGVLLFPTNGDEGEQYFNGLGPGMWNLLILLTTANFPDVMMPEYSKNRYSFAFFGIFVTLGVFLILNVVTAMVFNVYSEQKSSHQEEKVVSHRNSVQMAWAELTKNGEEVVAFDVMRQVLNELHHYHDVPYITAEDANQYLKKLDTSHSKVINWQDFQSLTDLLVKRIDHTPREPLLERWSPGLKKHPHWIFMKQAVLHGRAFDFAIDALLIASVALTVMETWGAIQGERSSSRLRQEEMSFQSVELYVSLAFVTEAVLKILLLGRDGYFLHLKNRFDFFVTMLTASVALYAYIPNGSNSAVVVRCAAMLRLFRILRLLTRVERYKIVIMTFVKVFPEMRLLVEVMLCAMYVFCVVGLQLFGGVINTDPASPYSAAVAASDFGTSNYYANNFNDMPSGMVLLFELLVVNNWFVLVDGFTATCGLWARLFFIVWYVVGVVIILNIVVACVLNSSFDAFARAAQEDEEMHREAARFWDSEGDEDGHEDDELMNLGLFKPIARAHARKTMLDAVEKDLKEDPMSLPAVLPVPRGHRASLWS